MTYVSFFYRSWFRFTLDASVWKYYLNPYSSNLTLENNTSSNVYGLSFSSDTALAQVGGMGGSVLFVGTEVLSINVVANTQPTFLEVYVKYEMNIIQSTSSNDTVGTSYIR